MHGGEQLWLWPRPQLLYGLVWHRDGLVVVGEQLNDAS